MFVFSHEFLCFKLKINFLLTLYIKMYCVCSQDITLESKASQVQTETQ